MNILKAEIIKNGMNQKEISNELGISYSSFNGKINGRQEFTLSEIQKMIDILSLNNANIFFDLKTEDNNSPSV